MSKRSLDADEQDLGLSPNIVLPATGALPNYAGVIEQTSDPSNIKAKAAALAFMEEPVDIMIHESTDPNAEMAVFVAVNGEGAGPHKQPWLPRGMAVTVKRKFVERLARAKPIGIATKEVVNSNGEKTTEIVKRRALGYPFSVIHDPNPNGPSWLKRILAEA